MIITAGIVSTIFQVILLIIIAGIIIVGGVGALWSRSRGGNLAGGFLRAVIVPPWPLGLAWVWWSTRSSAHALSESAPTSGDGEALRGPPMPPIETPRSDEPPAGSGGRRF